MSVWRLARCVKLEQAKSAMINDVKWLLQRLHLFGAVAEGRQGLLHDSVNIYCEFQFRAQPPTGWGFYLLQWPGRVLGDHRLWYRACA